MADEESRDTEPAASHPPAEAAPAPRGRLRRWLRRWPRLHRYGRWSLALAVALACAALVSVVTVDLGPSLRGQAEQRFADYLDRPVRIGRLSTYLLPGRFLIEDLVIDGLSPGDRPFFRGERIVVSTAWLPLLYANPALNGLIVGVLALGIAYSFRQVMTLRREVNWIVNVRTGKARHLRPGRAPPARPAGGDPRRADPAVPSLGRWRSEVPARRHFRAARRTARHRALHDRAADLSSACWARSGGCCRPSTRWAG